MLFWDEKNSEQDLLRKSKSLFLSMWRAGGQNRAWNHAGGAASKEEHFCSASLYRFLPNSVSLCYYFFILLIFFFSNQQQYIILDQ